MKELRKLLNGKVIAVQGDTLYFDNGLSVNLHRYETYIEKYDKKRLNVDRLQYYCPSHFEKDY